MLTVATIAFGAPVPRRGRRMPMQVLHKMRSAVVESKKQKKETEREAKEWRAWHCRDREPADYSAILEAVSVLLTAKELYGGKKPELNINDMYTPFPN